MISSLDNSRYCDNCYLLSDWTGKWKGREGETVGRDRGKRQREDTEGRDRGKRQRERRETERRDRGERQGKRQGNRQREKMGQKMKHRKNRQVLTAKNWFRDKWRRSYLLRRIIEPTTLFCTVLSTVSLYSYWPHVEPTRIWSAAVFCPGSQTGTAGGQTAGVGPAAGGPPQGLAANLARLSLQSTGRVSKPS